MIDRVRNMSRLALLLALATVIHTIEALLPTTVVWFRFGFANIIGLATLYLFGFKAAVFVTAGRIFLGSLVTGLFGSPAFLLSFSGGTSAILAMGLAYRCATPALSEIGVSIAGAVAHNMAQLAVAYLILVRNEGILVIAPFLLVTALGTGFINGLAARLFVHRYRAHTGS